MPVISRVRLKEYLSCSGIGTAEQKIAELQAQINGNRDLSNSLAYEQ